MLELLVEITQNVQYHWVDFDDGHYDHHLLDDDGHDDQVSQYDQPEPAAANIIIWC